MEANNILLPGDPMLFSGLFGHQAFMWYMYIHAGKTFIHMRNLKKKSFIPLETAGCNLDWTTEIISFQGCTYSSIGM
ncbi:hypothetical protein I79_007093 [Cricetulus griseus]|uniref:Uncharacterized protein n=1 Tax=Cricetulus griseus TaxID=10029 RepID=G3H9L7_CRIGR|nr:hypothetical protein I79_007093 [Cricetulus griseus]